jgi:phage terminase large subunit
VSLPSEGQRPYKPYGAIYDLFKCHDDAVLVEGPAGCVAGETRIYLANKGCHTQIETLWKCGFAPVVMTLYGPRQATVPFLKGVADLFRVVLDDGREITVTDHHKFLTRNGWCRLDAICVGDDLLRFDACRPVSSLGLCPSKLQQDDLRSIRKVQGSLADYLAFCRSYDAQLHGDRDIDQGVFPLLADVLECSRVDLQKGVAESRSEHNRFYQSFDRLSKTDYFDPIEQNDETESERYEGSVSQFLYSFQVDERYQKVTVLQQLAVEVFENEGGRLQPDHDWPESQERGGSDLQRIMTDSIVQPLSSDEDTDGKRQRQDHVEFSFTHSKVRWGTVSRIEFVRRDFYFDLHVPGAGHYLAEGFWNHNTGKTRGVLERIFHLMNTYHGARALLCRKTRVSMTESVLVTFESKVLPTKSPVRDGPTRRIRGSYTLPKGSEIVISGLDEPARIMSTEFDVIGVFEATEITTNDFELLVTRLRNNVIPFQQIIMDCNPGSPNHWLNVLASKGRLTRLLSRHRHNPMLFDMRLNEFTDAGEKYLKKLSYTLTGVRRARLLDGKWAATEGAVYDFDRSKHIVDKMPPGWEKWRKVGGIDFGFQNPFVCLWAAIDKSDDNTVYIYREIYKSHRIVSEHASGVWDTDPDTKVRLLVEPGIKQLSEGEDIETFVADHDAEGRATLDAEGIIALPAYKEDKLQGIEAVKERLRPVLHGDGSVRPRLFFLRDALVQRDDELVENGLPYCTVDEFEGYIWKKVKESSATGDRKAPKEEPEDKNDHGADCIRYLIAYIDDLAGQQISLTAEAPTAVEGTW